MPFASQASGPEVQAPALVAPSLGCGATPATTARFTRVALHRPRHHQPPPRRRIHPHPRAEAAPPAEPQPTLSQAYFTCLATPLEALPVGTGWLAVGPLRRS